MMNIFEKVQFVVSCWEGIPNHKCKAEADAYLHARTNAPYFLPIHEKIGNMSQDSACFILRRPWKTFEVRQTVLN